ncbi:potassium channel family protein [Nonomuraea sediminis]|uniref:potassium channel family protein n=1 Tax=Nonomuraea sediminis TaxID=2835864 RepID=UPI001BDD8D2D|nr:potassium channel family protein [Nonomuraea sediminis]
MWRAVRNVVLVVAVYYLLPLDVQQGPWAVGLRVLGVVVGIVLVAWGVWAATVREAAGEADQGIRLDLLIVVSVVGVVVFALADYFVAHWGNGEFVGLITRTDALYFAVSTLVTVGFGDVHAEGQIGRGLVMIQMVFNVVVLAAAFSLLRHVAGIRRRKRAQEE